MAIDPSIRPPVVLIHGFWLTARSWERWVDYYSAQGFEVLAPAYPGLEAEVDALRADSTPIRDLTVPAIVGHLEQVVQDLDRPPILIGHSAGGLWVQMLLDRGYGAAGVAISSLPPEGVRTTPPSQVKAVFPVLGNPANHHRAVELTHEQFHYAFTNTMTENESRQVYDRYAVAAPGRIVWEGVLANFKPGHQDAWVDYSNPDRAPLLFIASGKDHVMPPSVNAANVKRYRKSTAVTELYEFPGRSHFTVGEPGWEAVADYALQWALMHAAASEATTNAG